MAEAPPPVKLTEKAANRLKNLIAAEGGDDLAFRVSVSGGGCSGFSYKFDLSREEEPSDIASNQHGVKVLVDDMSLLYVLGSEIDYVEDLIGASFQVKNPNAQSSCGCGSSFSV
ncbi:heme biosynthesis protein HemY [Iodidimonas gelatinilytica]|uniref:Heme biosynthesis protein HemY n=2 Tax=Iodidimonas TaxID=2066486 RepID=A0A5A7MV45_9PROT|nr:MULTISPECIES: iron-sulfur cluster insertion protein ErpA [Iodidimonas]GEQ98775.1 heme biosynthesis protein HemY [Iodidimonas gelatinilytica]GER06313.1 heme biosynthesis protein HemY [Kordiimonadales bacterium JCM 17843]GGO04262.1 heme biosynthesis protein HemY [Iodidimonas muriae]